MVLYTLQRAENVLPVILVFHTLFHTYLTSSGMWPFIPLPLSQLVELFEPAHVGGRLQRRSEAGVQSCSSVFSFEMSNYLCQLEPGLSSVETWVLEPNPHEPL